MNFYSLTFVAFDSDYVRHHNSCRNQISGCHGHKQPTIIFNLKVLSFGPWISDIVAVCYSIQNFIEV